MSNIGTLPLHRSYGYGIAVIWLKRDRTWAVQQHRELLRIGDYDAMTRYARELSNTEKRLETKGHGKHR